MDLKPTVMEMPIMDGIPHMTPLLIAGAFGGVLSLLFQIYTAFKCFNQKSKIWNWIPRDVPKTTMRSVTFSYNLYSIMNLLAIALSTVFKSWAYPTNHWGHIGMNFIQFLGSSCLVNAFIGTAQVLLEHNDKKEGSAGIWRTFGIVATFASWIGGSLIMIEHWNSGMLYSLLQLVGSTGAIVVAIVVMYFAWKVLPSNEEYPCQLKKLTMVNCFLAVLMEIIKILCIFQIIPKELSFTSVLPLLPLVTIVYGNNNYKPPPVEIPKPIIYGKGPRRGTKPYATLVIPRTVSTINVRPAYNPAAPLPPITGMYLH